MAKTLQQIEDYYVSQGLRDDALRKAIEGDKEYQALLKERKKVIRKKYNITEQEEKDYPLPNEEDYQILSTVKTLESKNLSTHDREVVELIKDQLKYDWREPLLRRLKELTKEYS